MNMKFALILEAVDRASKIITTVTKVQQAAGAGSQKAANAAAAANKAAAAAAAGNLQATADMAQTQTKAARAAEKAAKAQAKAAAANKAAANAANAGSRGLMAQTRAFLSVNKAANLYRKTLDKINKSGLTAIRGGWGKMKTAGSGAYSRALRMAAIGAGGQAGAAALFIKPARQYSELQTQLAKVTHSSGEAKKSMEWVIKTQMPPHGVMDLAQGFVALRTAGIDPTRGALAAVADAATASGKSVADVTAAMQSAFAGDYAALGELGIQAQNQGRYIAYMFKDSQGHLKRIRAGSRDTGAQAAAMAEAMRRANGGAAAKAALSWKGMTARFGDMFDRIRLRIMSGGLYQFLTDKMKQINALMDKYMSKIEGWVKDKTLNDKIKKVTDALENGFSVGVMVVTHLYNAGGKLYGVLDKVAGAIGGWDRLLAGLMVIPFIPFIAQIVSGVGMIVSGIGGLISLGAPLMGAFKVLLIGLRMASLGFIQLGIAIMTTPIGWVIAGIAAVAAAAYLIYKNWDKIGPYFWALWDKVKSIFTGFWDWFKSLFTAGNIGGIILTAFAPMIGLPMLIYKNWDKIGPYFRALWEGIKAAAGEAWDWLADLFSWEGIAAKFTAIKDGFINFYGGLWAEVQKLAAKAWEDLKALFSWDGIKAIFDALKDGIIGVFRDIWDYVGGIFNKISNAWNSIKGWFGGGNAAQAGANAAAAVQAANAARAGQMPAPLAATPEPRAPAKTAEAKADNISLNFAPNISIQGAEPSAVKKAMEDIYAQFKRELPRLMEEANRRKQRLAY